MEIEEEFCAIMESIKSEDTKIHVRCRLCATPNPAMVDIFWSNESTEDISVMIEHSLPIVVEERDTLPKQICRVCLEKLELCFQFQRSVAEAEKLLLAFDGQARIKLKQMERNHHTWSPPSESCILEHDDIERTLLTVLDEGIDNNQSATTVRENQTADTNLESKSILTSLKPCSVTLVRMKTHCRNNPHQNGEGNSMTSRKQDSDVLMDVLNVGGPSTCHLDVQGLCESSVSVRTCRGSGAIEQESLSTYCEGKSENSGRPAAPQEAHPMVETHSECKSAVKTFTSRGKENRRQHDPEGLYECSLCKKTFNTFSVLRLHRGCHSKNRDYRCFMCDKTFVCESAVNLHMIVHSGEKPWECDYCKRGFGRKNNLKRHLSFCKQRMEISKGSHKCDLCMKLFLSKSSLSAHYRLHTGRGLQKCEYCPKNFTSRSQRNLHHRVHANKRPYECAICPRKFKYSSSLVRHVIGHSNVENQMRLLCGESSETTLLKSNK